MAWVKLKNEKPGWELAKDKAEQARANKRSFWRLLFRKRWRRKETEWNLISGELNCYISMYEDMKEKFQNAEQLKGELQEQLKSAQERIRQVEHQLQEYESSAQKAAAALPLSKAVHTLRVPCTNYEDHCVNDLMRDLVKMLDAEGITVKLNIDGPHILPGKGVVVVPVRFPYVQRGMENAQLDDRCARSDIIVIIFHCQPPHNSRIRVATPDKIDPDAQELVAGCRLVTDAVYCGREMYACKTNEDCVAELKRALCQARQQ